MIVLGSVIENISGRDKMKTITFMEMVELSFSDEYRNWLMGIFPEYKFNPMIYTGYMIAGHWFEDFLEEKEYKIAI